MHARTIFIDIFKFNATKTITVSILFLKIENEISSVSCIIVHLRKRLLVSQSGNFYHRHHYHHY